MALWVFQLRFPPLSYPAVGLFLAVFLAGGVLLRILRPAAAGADSWRNLRQPALLPGMLFTLWTTARWIGDGAPSNGAAEVGSILWAALYFSATLLVCGSFSRSEKLSGSPETVQPSSLSPQGAAIFNRVFVLTGTLVGLICGLYAIWQYHAGYASTYADLLRSIGAHKPDRMEAALLHHLQLRRVASFLGDPNTYAALASLTIAAGIEIMTWRGRWTAVLRLFAGASIAASLVGIYYTGSRGGVLDTLLVMGLFGIIWLDWFRRTRNDKSVPGKVAHSGSIAFLVFAALVMSNPSRGPAATEKPVPGNASGEANAQAWVWRSDTVRERLFYLDVGRKMILLAPVIGLGPGSVDDYFGRLKDPAARETRNLHNWPVQVWAEFGAVGLILLLWFTGALLWRGVQCRAWRVSAGRWPLMVIVVLLFDGLLQSSWFQRELMSNLGIACGLLVSFTGRHDDANPPMAFWTRVAGFSLLSLGFLLTELPYLAGQSNKILARDALAANDPVTAIRYAEKATRWVPRDPEPYILRASLASEAGRPSAALQLIRKAIKINPESAALNSQAAGLYLQLRQVQSADVHLQRALELYPSSPDYNSQYSQVLEMSGRYGEALVYARRALENTYLDDEQPAAEAAVHRLEKVVKESPR